MIVSRWFSCWASHLRALRGGRRYGTAILYGAVAALAFPPFNALAGLWFCFPALVFLLQGTEKLRQAFAIGWCFSFGLLTVSFYWIADSMFVDIGQYWWVVPLAVTGLPAFFGFYYGLATLAARRWGVLHADGILLLGLLWFAADYARGHLFTGFPWDVTGYVWATILPVVQITSVIGVYGLGLLTLIAVLLPAALGWRGIALGLAVFIGLAAWGQERLSHASDAIVPNVRLRLVQADTDQASKWRQDVSEKHFDQLLDTTFPPDAKPVTHVIWPETAIAFFLTDDPERRREIAARMPQGTLLLTGIVRQRLESDGTTRYYNALIALDDHGRVVAGYDKTHLVPFGEYIPFRSRIPIPAIAGMGTDFSAGDGLQTLRVAGLPPFSPLICYEAIFSGEVTADERPAFLLNVTNDAWYEHTTGPYQHFAIARVRAIEEGLPLVRVANKGLVAVVDSYGRIKTQLGWDRASFVDSDLPQALKPPPLFPLYGREILAGMVAFLFVIVFSLGWKRRRTAGIASPL